MLLLSTCKWIIMMKPLGMWIGIWRFWQSPVCRLRNVTWIYILLWPRLSCEMVLGQTYFGYNTLWDFSALDGLTPPPPQKKIAWTTWTSDLIEITPPPETLPPLQKTSKNENFSRTMLYLGLVRVPWDCPRRTKDSWFSYVTVYSNRYVQVHEQQNSSLPFAQRNSRD